jgi:flagellar hook-associated protein 3 FlgL
VLTGMIDALTAGEGLPEGSADALKTIGDQTTAAQASIGARAARVDLVAAQQTTAATDREATRTGLEDVDVTQAITDLQKTMTVLQATQASFSKLSALSLFDYLR